MKCALLLLLTILAVGGTDAFLFSIVRFIAGLARDADKNDATTTTTTTTPAPPKNHLEALLLAARRQRRTALDLGSANQLAFDDQRAASNRDGRADVHKYDDDDDDEEGDDTAKALLRFLMGNPPPHVPIKIAVDGGSRRGRVLFGDPDTVLAVLAADAVTDAVEGGTG